MAGFFTFNRTISAIAREFKRNVFFGNAFSEKIFGDEFDMLFSMKETNSAGCFSVLFGRYQYNAPVAQMTNQVHVR